MFLPTTPTFVLPYKRYAGPTLLHLAAAYVENDKRSYRETAGPGGRVRGYQTPTNASAIDERALAHSTLWWMLAWLGAQVAALAKGRQLVQQQHPHSTCHRFVGAVAPDKFRSRQRELSLCRSRQLLHLRAEWDELFYRTRIRVVGKRRNRAVCPGETICIINLCPDDFSAFCFPR